MGALAGPILLVGCGKMGGALLQGWLRSGLAVGDALVVEPAPALRRQVEGDFGVRVFADPHELPAAALRALVIAVKPQLMAEVLPSYAPLAARGPVVLSIAAGTPIARFEAAFGAETAIARAMPNTPAAIGRGVSVLTANRQVDAAQRHLCTALMAAVGSVHWIDDEAQMHVVTALSGGGPAYVFLLIECMAKAAIKAGLPEALAWPLARATVAGSGALAEAEAATPVEVLRANVTSPGGTTAAALRPLLGEPGMALLFERAIQAAAVRSQELA